MYDPGLVELFAANIDQLEAAATEAVRNMRELSFRACSGKPGAGVRPPETNAATPIPTDALEAIPELDSLAEFCTGWGNQLCLSDLLLNLECRLRRLLPFSTCAFFLNAGDGDLWIAHAGGKCADGMQNLRIAMDSGISGWVAACGDPVMNSRAALGFQGWEGDFSSLAHALIVPLNQDGLCLGTISLYAEAAHSFADDHLRILQMAANHVAPVLAQVCRRTAIGLATAICSP